MKAIETIAGAVAAFLALNGTAAAQPAPVPPKPATAATKAANAAVLKALPFSDKEDFENATRGFIGKPDTLTIKDAKGNVVWDLEAYKKFIGVDKPAPDTVNPSLWRNAQLNMQYGLFKVTDRIYQVRGYDLSNITFIQGDTGWIVFDPLISAETAKAAYDLVTQASRQEAGRRRRLQPFARRPLRRRARHRRRSRRQGGQGARSSRPKHFTEHAVSENVIAGNAMSRRAIYMYGALLPRNAQGGVNGGLGQTTSTGTATLIEPDRHHHEDRRRR